MPAPVSEPPCLLCVCVCSERVRARERERERERERGRGRGREVGGGRERGEARGRGGREAQRKPLGPSFTLVSGSKLLDPFWNPLPVPPASAPCVCGGWLKWGRLAQKVSVWGWGRWARKGAGPVGH